MDKTKWSISDVTLKPVGEITFEDYTAAVREVEMIAALKDSVLYWVGDLVLLGERQWPETYHQAWSEGSGLLERLGICARVAAGCDEEIRRRAKGWWRAKEIYAKQPAEQVAILSQVEEEGLNTEELRRLARGKKVYRDEDVKRMRGKGAAGIEELATRKWKAVWEANKDGWAGVDEATGRAIWESGVKLAAALAAQFGA